MSKRFPPSNIIDVNLNTCIAASFKTSFDENYLAYTCKSTVHFACQARDKTLLFSIGPQVFFSLGQLKHGYFDQGW